MPRGQNKTLLSNARIIERLDGLTEQVRRLGALVEQIDALFRRPMSSAHAPQPAAGAYPYLDGGNKLPPGHPSEDRNNGKAQRGAQGKRTRQRPHARSRQRGKA